jgi:outer membrane lipoprotein SlyB
MVVPKKSLMLAGAALALFGAATSAQSHSGKVFARYNKPLKSLSLDLGTGTITRGSKVTNRKGNTLIDFDNLDLGGFVGVDTGNGFCKWIDAADKGTGAGRTASVDNDSDLMNSIVFAYCSSRLTPGSGGDPEEDRARVLPVLRSGRCVRQRGGGGPGWRQPPSVDLDQV